MAITAPGDGDEDGRGHNIVISASSCGSGVVPADVEIAVAFGTAHAGGALFQPSAFPAVGTHTIARPPRRGETSRTGGPWPDGPADRTGGGKTERRTRGRTSAW